jgi:hypothetical protein
MKAVLKKGDILHFSEGPEGHFAQKQNVPFL